MKVKPDKSDRSKLLLFLILIPFVFFWMNIGVLLTRLQGSQPLSVHMLLDNLISDIYQSAPAYALAVLLSWLILHLGHYSHKAVIIAAGFMFLFMNVAIAVTFVFAGSGAEINFLGYFVFCCFYSAPAYSVLLLLLCLIYRKIRKIS
jgi:hypothetical protein